MMIQMTTKTRLFVIIISACSMTTVFAQSKESSKRSLLSYVDPYIGSSAHGHVFVGASVPFGAVQAGPDNINKGWDWCSGYHYSDSVVKGFSQDHLNGTGIPDLGDILIMPYTGTVRTIVGSQKNPDSGYAAYYHHRDEVVQPAYYALTKSDGVKVELTASERVSFHKYSFPKQVPAHIIIDLQQGNYSSNMKTDKVSGYLEKADDYTLVGWRNSSGWAADRRIYFAIKSNRPLRDFVIYNGDQIYNGNALEAKVVKGLVSFSTIEGPVLLKVGLSPVSSQNALANIKAEIPGWSFDKVVKEGDRKWNKILSLVQIETKDEVLKKIFYTALYHTMIAPALYNDADGSYRGADKKIYPKASFNNYTIFSLWDTYRTLNPFLAIVQPARTGDFINSMLAIYEQQGKLPIWHLQGNETNCMVGYSAVPIIANAYLNGISGFDPSLALEAMKVSSNRDDFGMKYIKERGYIPADKEVESVSKAMEYALSDWCIAQVAKKLHRDDDYLKYSRRAKYYRRYFDTATHFVRGVMLDGTYRTPFNPVTFDYKAYDFTEGTSWQYTWLVPQDVEGLIQLMGGDEAFVTKLDSLFTIKENLGVDAPLDISGLIGLYAHGNEPNHHIPYLYAFAGQQWKTAERVRQITTEMYTAKPEGLCGNDDCGQMSAWYIMSALGFYPVNPANGVFVLGSPLINKAVINTGNGKTFSVIASNNNAVNKYIESAMLNGKPYKKSYILYSDIVQGGELKLIMGPSPNKDFGKFPGNRPFTQLTWEK
jgi:predicted alpha-1,2-mannosidase